jgi:hypothetical protein
MNAVGAAPSGSPAVKGWAWLSIAAGAVLSLSGFAVGGAAAAATEYQPGVHRAAPFRARATRR